MLYADFERAFEARLQTRADAYLNAVEYYQIDSPAWSPDGKWIA